MNVFIHDIPRDGPLPYHDHGKPTELWHDFPVREVTKTDALAEGCTPCRFCFADEFEKYHAG